MAIHKIDALIVSFLLFTIPLPNYVYADKHPDFFAMSLEELMFVKITSSTLTENTIRSVPAAVTTFNHQQLMHMGLDTLDELMNITPGFQSYRTSTTSLAYPYSSRGRRISAGSAEILIMVDGNRLDDARLSGATQINPKFPLSQIEQVEFIRGPGAAVYGSNAMLGLINITTRSNANEFIISTGTFRRRKVDLLTSTSMGKVNINFVGQFDSDHGDNYRLNDTFSSSLISTDDPRQVSNISLSLNWQDTQLKLNHNRYSTQNFYELENISNDYNKRSGNQKSISIKHIFNWQSIQAWYWLSYNESTTNTAAQLTAPGALFSLQNGDPASNPQSNDALFVSANFKDYSEIRSQIHNDWKINTKNSLQFGLELRYINAPQARSENNFNLSDIANNNYPIRYYGSLASSTVVQTKSTRKIVGLYIQHLHQLHNNLNITLGLRYDKFSGIGSELSPRFALVHKLNNKHSLKLLYGKAFRAPSETDLNLFNNPVILGNSNLEPETVQTLDIIWVGQWHDTNLSMGYFENHFENSIIESVIDGKRQPANIAQSPVKGTEIELSRELDKQWTLRTTYTQFFEKPDISFRETDKKASLMINYQRNKWNANLIFVKFNQREMTIGNNKTDRLRLNAYSQIFSKVSYRFNTQWRSFLQIKNTLNENYLTPTTGSILSGGVANRGREILLGIKWEY